MRTHVHVRVESYELHVCVVRFMYVCLHKQVTDRKFQYGNVFATQFLCLICLRIWCMYGYVDKVYGACPACIKMLVSHTHIHVYYT